MSTNDSRPNIPEIDPLRCPLCGQPNHCAYAAGQSHTTCWCNNLSVPKPLLEQIPDQFRRKACVCENCVRTYIANHGVL
ncbi:cysteine-rich CWC family protein [Paenibacillus sp. D2_2]|uniref:cysteine-rich CWC family protein n=1 Tax=Paenibacillus sp. D2_2 TaxID=3073092 RepID=UPI0028165F41|nr:cysteine-rich CWC family protein [Paenibacillus sp. D2_2]WMT39320.1 cysteine-rich CWC family protein [Paenibacillus sp. D2_2]